MIQWEPDIVCEDDVSVIVRCDRPEDFNKTVEWSFETRHLLATLERSQHPGESILLVITIMVVILLYLILKDNTCVPEDLSYSIDK